MKNITFSINETSKITMLSKDALRFYEKTKLVVPNKNPFNKYRYYTLGDITSLNYIKYLRSLDISIKDIQLIFNSNSDEKYLYLKKHHQFLLDKIEQLTKLEKILKNTLEDNNPDKSIIKNPKIKYLEKRYFKYFINSNSNNYSLKNLKNILIQYPNNSVDLINNFTFILNDTNFKYEYLHNFFNSVNIDNNFDCYIEITNEYKDISSYDFSLCEGLYAEFIIEASNDLFDEEFKNIFKWLDSNNYKFKFPGTLKFLDSLSYLIDKDIDLVKIEIPILEND